jgi:hypothetical protein
MSQLLAGMSLQVPPLLFGTLVKHFLSKRTTGEGPKPETSCFTMKYFHFPLRSSRHFTDGDRSTYCRLGLPNCQGS